MKPLGIINVPTVIPETLSRLSDISQNFWWTWNCEAVELFRSIGPCLWDELGVNPVSFLRKVGTNKLQQKAESKEFLYTYKNVVNKFDEYINSTNTWFSNAHPEHTGYMTAYFSAEFGLHETLPIYSGGLGILSGDHCKSASDLGIPFTAIGLFYRQGYFNQIINRDGIQETAYSTLNLEDLAITQVNGSNGEKLLVSVDLPGRTVYVSIWQVKVGRVNLYLLDSDVPGNNEHDRYITARLYGGDGDTRIQQEILLGIGGVKTLEALGIKASVYHMNEGHSAFLCFELMRKFMQEQKLGFKEACEAVASSSVFTTHTPVPAGIDVFSHDIMDTYFTGFRESLGVSREEFLSLGNDASNPYGFNMAAFALKMAAHRNGVSKLHGKITRRMFNRLWPDVPEDEVPVTHVTNGIHTLTWLAPLIKKLLDKYFVEGWENRISETEIWKDIDKIPDEELWQEHLRLKAETAFYINNRHISSNPGLLPVRTDLNDSINPEFLTIGFSRRFATYKRAALIFRDINRIKRILNIDSMPVQLIFAGKAHPADKPAQEVIKQINDIANQEGFQGKVFLLENYNIALARRLVQGVDVWLNNPRLPLEASGTSGQKACINGVVNLSVPDGWWREGYNGSNGWAIGTGNSYDNEYYQDNIDSASLYAILEKSLIPLYYNRNEKGIPVGWVKMMKESICSLAAAFSTQRMVQEYTDRLYMPALNRYLKNSADDFLVVRQLAGWKKYIEKNWQHVSISHLENQTGKNDLQTDMGYQQSVPGKKIVLEAVVGLGELRPDDVKAELYYGCMDGSGNIGKAEISPMEFTEEISPGTFKVKSELMISCSGEYGFNFRIYPYSTALSDKFDFGLVKWAGK